MEYELERNSRNVITLNFADPTESFELWLMLSSDRHHDNVSCDRRLETAHLDKALERDALIFDFGDLFCAMQGKYDPRSDMSDIRSEDVGTDYLDRIVTHAARDYAKYAGNIVLLAHGNHETNILKRHGTDITSNLIHRMNTDNAVNIQHGLYGGYVILRFGKHRTVRMKYFHGAGGGGPVTRGVIQTNRQAVYLPDADVIVNGHTHDEWVLPIARERLSIRGVVGRDVLWFARTAGYKNDYADGATGWQVERWGPPKPLGCVWAHFYHDMNSRGRIGIELIPEVV
jgi:hypothetical protein